MSLEYSFEKKKPSSHKETLSKEDDMLQKWPSETIKDEKSGHEAFFEFLVNKNQEKQENKKEPEEYKVREIKVENIEVPKVVLEHIPSPLYLTTPREPKNIEGLLMGHSDSQRTKSRKRSGRQLSISSIQTINSFMHELHLEQFKRYSFL
mmetsp:Transcript_32775/g.32002  ORF Transcript_32775/g.32002 Transcript_32775/m.32002 type:complete len:150 (+) Transcript_32775:59-508(+)